MAHRIAVGGLLHETHTFAPTPTTLDDFRATWHAGPNLLTNLRGTQTGVGGMIDGLEDRDWEPIPTFYAAALPAGTVTESAYKVLKAEMCARTQAALPLDGVLLHLHGAMVSETTLDAETDITEAIRTIVGPNVPIVVELDMHGNISPALAEQADILLGYDTTPHMDLRAKGMEAVAVLEGLLTSRLRPTTAVRNIPCLLAPQVTDTSDLPLRAVFDKVRAMKADSRVVAVSVFGGFAYADTPWTGASVFVHTNDTPGLARELAAELEETLMDHRSAAVFQALPPGEAVREALGTPDGPVILVDSADNIGGGTPGDGTDALKAMLAADVQEGTVVIADPEAVRACRQAGVGSSVTTSIGGKTDEFHGSPITVTGTVRTLSDGLIPCEQKQNHFAAFYGDTLDMGDSAWLRSGGVNIILNSRKTPPFDLAQLRGMGVVPEEQKMIAVKAAVAYRAAYLPITARIVEMDTAGLCTANLHRFDYRNIPRPIFPLDTQ